MICKYLSVNLPLAVYTDFYTICSKKINKYAYTLGSISSVKEVVFMGFSEDFGSSSEHQLENGVVVYTSEGCPRCDMLKKWLKNKDTNFEEKNLGDSDEW